MIKLLAVLFLVSFGVAGEQAKVEDLLVRTLNSTKSPKPWFGSKMSVELKDVLAPQAFKLFEESYGLRLKVGEELKARKISVMAANQPWDEVFHSILKKEGLAATMENGVVVIKSQRK